MYRKHSFEEKLNLVSQVKQGMPITRLCRIHKLDDKMLRGWVRKYDIYGEQGLHKEPNIRATSELKVAVIRLIREKDIPLPQVALQYGISLSALKCWGNTVKTNGYEALCQQKKRGRPSKSMGGAKKHKPETELEKLQAENRRLRAENALLKKSKP